MPEQAPDDGPASTFAGFSSQELAELTGVSHDWVLQLCRKGEVAHHRLGDRVWFTADDLDALTKQAASPRRRSRRSSRRGWLR
jgi:excisionase family DNA binding protein